MEAPFRSHYFRVFSFFLRKNNKTQTWNRMTEFSTEFGSLIWWHFVLRTATQKKQQLRNTIFRAKPGQKLHFGKFTSPQGGRERERAFDEGRTDRGGCFSKKIRIVYLSLEQVDSAFGHVGVGRAGAPPFGNKTFISVLWDVFFWCWYWYCCYDFVGG